jgi:hypothetical protein
VGCGGPRRSEGEDNPMQASVVRSPLPNKTHILTQKAKLVKKEKKKAYFPSFTKRQLLLLAASQTETHQTCAQIHSL